MVDEGWGLYLESEWIKMQSWNPGRLLEKDRLNPEYLL